eukprot:COSAG01_NODE_35288_length_534_cov_0.944828_1_plen_146_part_01
MPHPRQAALASPLKKNQTSANKKESQSSSFYSKSGTCWRILWPITNTSNQLAHRLLFAESWTDRFQNNWSHRHASFLFTKPTRIWYRTCTERKLMSTNSNPTYREPVNNWSSVPLHKRITELSTEIQESSIPFQTLIDEVGQVIVG